MQFSLSPGKYFSSGFNVLTNGLKTLDITKKDFFQLKFSQSHGRSLRNYYRVDYRTVWDPLRC